MERLWAPWRIELIKQLPLEECFFCKYIKEDKDKENLILERGKRCFVMMNKFPYAEGHLMIVPYEHTGDFTAIDSKVRFSLMEYTARWQTLLKKALNPQGFNIGLNLGKVAGAGVADHLHIHVVPRWNGDTNFLPIIGNSKVINQAIGELYDILKKICLENPSNINEDIIIE